jgi:hypothetical protein
LQRVAWRSQKLSRNTCSRFDPNAGTCWHPPARIYVCMLRKDVYTAEDCKVWRHLIQAGLCVQCSTSACCRLGWPQVLCPVRFGVEASSSSPRSRHCVVAVQPTHASRSLLDMICCAQVVVTRQSSKEPVDLNAFLMPQLHPKLPGLLAQWNAPCLCLRL